ncbi:MAG TPA: CBS domain-containing protein [Nitrosopumilaceae archaeon]|nr:CBS domain-containing protein [Nitrosopumilaceae archaeon]
MKKPITIDKDTPIYDAITIMREKRISRLFVTEQKTPTGIATEKDMGFFLLQDKTDRDIDEIPVAEVTKKLVSVSESTKVGDCARIMLEKDFSSLGVNLDNTIVGIITKTDLTKYYADTYKDKNRVGDFMTKSYVSSYLDEPVHNVVSKMLENKISRIIVKNHDDVPTGIISFRDLFRIALDLGMEEFLEDNTRDDLSVIFSRKGFLSESGFGAITSAAQIMTGGILSVLHGDDLAKACEILLDNKVKGLGVISEKGDLVGILTKTDITHALAAAE